MSPMPMYSFLLFQKENEVAKTVIKRHAFLLDLRLSVDFSTNQNQKS